MPFFYSIRALKALYTTHILKKLKKYSKDLTEALKQALSWFGAA